MVSSTYRQLFSQSPPPPPHGLLRSVLAPTSPNPPCPQFRSIFPNVGSQLGVGRHCQPCAPLRTSQPPGLQWSQQPDGFLPGLGQPGRPTDLRVLHPPRGALPFRGAPALPQPPGLPPPFSAFTTRSDGRGLADVWAAKDRYGLLFGIHYHSITWEGFAAVWAVKDRHGLLFDIH